MTEPSPTERAHVRIQGLSLHLTAADGSDAYKASLLRCREELRKFIDEVNCAPILIRCAWHDAGTYDRLGGAWPKCGGANGSIRFEVELGHGANAGLPKAINYLQRFKKAHPEISWADLIQLAGATAVEVTGGPTIPMRYGRVDTQTPEECPREGNLPGAAAPFGDGAADASAHLRNVFYRMGMNDQEIVALSGAHTLGRAFKERSGTVEQGYGPKSATPFTCPVFRAR
eukprot:CAMPEP_0118921836 /NCGR_PEP_ID=MMETSP1169-20130426/989_1 /TAXON_ID=36882 /ORGANISM="Pyramimonas obovata, Strain CCMP722" /LENGTH=228 /DNA_ID=CAMNT_0006862627 /DNA_START=57 /DNA_END=739 /DNA_ORIENTATION=+